MRLLLGCVPAGHATAAAMAVVSRDKGAAARAQHIAANGGMASDYQVHACILYIEPLAPYAIVETHAWRSPLNSCT